MEFICEKKNGWEYYHVPQITQAGIIHGFFTRNSPSFTPANPNIHDFLDVFLLDDAVSLVQEHGNDIHVVKRGDRPDKGDGILLYKRGIAGVIKTADCLCVICIDPAFPMVSIVHAGWRGTLQKITSKAIGMMVERGAARERVMALMSPSIRGCCYAVGPDVKEAFLREGFRENIFRSSEEKIYLDLALANAALLSDAGIETIYDTGFCTYCSSDPDFASYRKGARNERQANFVAIR
ncbi:MAG: polyphenol oxidase family protein [Syntrophorhabdaceae bacterium]